MPIEEVSSEIHEALEAMLGYLNFSAGASDSAFLGNLNEVYRLFSGPSEAGPACPWEGVCELLLAKLDQLQRDSETFRDAVQARGVLTLSHQHLLPAYSRHHRDLLFHQDAAVLFGPFFLGRVYEAVLACGNQAPEVWSADAEPAEQNRLVEGALRVLNDYIGHRPVAALETAQKIEPYDHERCRPIPLYIRGAGAACGRYESLITRTIEILNGIDRALLDEANFDVERIDELAMDPRAYDFDHPVNKRPNYQFGGWDPHAINNHGHYCRYIVQQVTLDALTNRIVAGNGIPQGELLLESAATLAGIILMGSGISGSGPESHSSDVTLNVLLPKIAAYRDAFYDHLLAQNRSVQRLQDEARQRHQPFAGVRQSLNAELARNRACQLQHVHLAKLYARMGHAEASSRQADVVPAASARFLCSIQCMLTDAQLRLDSGQIAEAAADLPVVVDALHRGIHCGAIVDPWNILGFDANFSLFPALENTVHDHRVDELLELTEQIFAVHARTWCLAAASDDQETIEAVENSLRELAEWWDRFAVTTVSSVSGFDGGPLHAAARRSAAALAAWHDAGTTSGNVAFWQPHVEQFNSPKAYVLVLNALLDSRDFVAAMALLMHWLSQSDVVPLSRGNDLFHSVATRWLDELLGISAAATESAASPFLDDSAGGEHVGVTAENWKLVTKFFDYLEANANEYWQVPKLDVGSPLASSAAAEESESELDDLDEGDEEEDDEDDVYAAAYDEMIYRDSTDDGIESELIGDDFPQTDYELEHEARRLSERLAFLITLSRLWKSTAQMIVRADVDSLQDPPASQRLSAWLSQLLHNRGELLRLLRDLAAHQLPKPSGSHASLLEYDRRRMIRDSLLERTIAAYVTNAEATLFVLAAGATGDTSKLDELLASSASILEAALRGDRQKAAECLETLWEHASGQTILYVPLSKGGDAQLIAAARARQRAMRLLLAVLPRLGMLGETARLLELCVDLERERPVGPGAVTEFDQLFRIGFQGMAECLVHSAAAWPARNAESEVVGSGGEGDAELELVEYLQQLTEGMLERWLEHSRTLRLSVLEKVSNEKRWQRLVAFVERYGADLFDQSFFQLANLRSILHQGVESWLNDLAETVDEDEMPLLAALEDDTTRRTMIGQLQLIIEAVVENYIEYRDYNGTTTQSDRGEMLYTLLGMLRLQISYDRVAWNLTPVAWAHEVLVRHGRLAVAEHWRHELTRRTAEMADQMIERLRNLQNEYGMRLSTVADRIGERFVRPLLIDRARALVRPAMAKTCHLPPADAAFEQFAQYVDELTRDPTGVGLDVPDWLEALEDEVERAVAPIHYRELQDDVKTYTQARPLSRSEVQDQLDDL